MQTHVWIPFTCIQAQTQCNDYGNIWQAAMIGANPSLVTAACCLTGMLVSQSICP